MSTMDDEQQRMAEEGKIDGSGGRDAIAYQMLFEILSERPAVVETTGFEDAIIRKIERARRRSEVLDHIWLISGLVSLVIIGTVAMAVSGLRIPLSEWQQNIVM